MQKMWQVKCVKLMEKMIEIFDTVIPMSVKAAETSAEGVSIFSHCLNGKVARAYETIAEEVLRNEE